MRDPNPELRRAAVSRISWYGTAAQQYVPVLRNMAQSDPDGNVRAAATTASLAIYEAQTGKPVTGAEADPFAGK
jgi:hypothetical protein